MRNPETDAGWASGTLDVRKRRSGPGSSSRNFSVRDQDSDVDNVRVIKQIPKQAAIKLFKALLSRNGVTAWGPEVLLSDWDLLASAQQALTVEERVALRDEFVNEIKLPWEDSAECVVRLEQERRA